MMACGVAVAWSDCHMVVRGVKIADYYIGVIVNKTRKMSTF